MRPRSHRPHARLVGAAGFALALALALSTTSQAQDSSALARYVPKENLAVYLEFDGIDGHADAWRKTAAYKILNNTPAGAMLEDVFAQLLEKVRVQPMSPIRSVDSVMGLVKHLAQSGFLLAVLDHPNDPKKTTSILVLRNAFKEKNVRTTIAAFLQNLNAPNTKPQAVIRAGHKVITGVNPMGKGFTWWVEDSKKEDIVLVFEKAEEVDVILDTLDGKRPSALEHPRRAELFKPENGFLPTGLAFIEPRTFQAGKFWEDLGLKNLTAIDLRWGFQDDALITTARVATTGPRQGVLALLDGPTFEKGQWPPIPETVGGFTVLAFDPKSTLEKLVGLAKIFKPDAEDKVNQFLDSMKATTKLRLKEDVLAHVGPKVAWYVLPSKASAAPGGSNIFSAMMAGAGMDQLPRLAIVLDIDDPVAFGKMLDEAMGAANRELKAQAAKGVGEVAKGSRNRGPTPPSLEFRRKEDPKTYFLSVPPELTSQYPASFRPAIQVGPKQVVIAVSIDVAKAALESKGTWTPSNELGSAFQGVSKLKVLNVSDPRETLPAILASFPARLQTGINTMILMRTNGANPPPAGSPPGQRPGLTGAPGANQAPAGPAPVVLKVDPAKLPTADSIKALLFPSVFTVEVKGDEIRITSRDAFPAFADPSKVSLSAMLPAMMGQGGPPPGMFPPPAGGPPGQPPSATGGAEPGRPPMNRRGGARP